MVAVLTLRIPLFDEACALRVPLFDEACAEDAVSAGLPQDGAAPPLHAILTRLDHTPRAGGPRMVYLH